uniref:Reverse transcriptase domain-containing protein n=1 Tax=Tanacetum cinerariifolium TaxID=118510 RepID=A0A6L2LZS4_TANCI|nr:reverse transcriptase domain-containing protein [Tanacetum cinerariifolium]
MRTRSSSNLVGESSPNPTFSNLKRHNRRRSKQPFILEESPVYTMSDQRNMVELLRAPTEGYAEAIVVPSILAEHFKLKHSLINMMTSDQFFRLEKDNHHDHIRAARRWLKKERSRSILTWEDLAWDRYKDLLRACPHPGFTELHQLDTFYNALNPTDQDYLNSTDGGNLLERRTQDMLKIIENTSKQTSVVTTAMTVILKQFQATPPPASVKAVEEIFVTYGGAHPYYQFVPLSELEKIKKMNEINIQAMQTQINNVKNELRNEMKTLIQASMSNQTNKLKNMMASFFQMNTASTSGSGPLPSKTIANPKGELKAITTRSGLVLDGPFVPMPPPFINLEEDERVEKTLTDPKLALLSNKEKLLEMANTPFNENCSVVILKKLPKKLGDPRKFLIPYGFSELKCKALADLGASINLMLLSVWKNLAVILKKLPEKLRDPGKFLIPCGFSELKYKALADLGASINLLPLTACALIDVHGEEMILCDGDERLTLYMKHDTAIYSNHPHRESANLINIFNVSSEDCLEVNISRMVSIRLLLGSARLHSSTEFSRIESISLVGSWLSKYSISLRSDSISKGRSSFPDGNVIRASSSTNSSSKWSREEEAVLPLNGLITSSEVKSDFESEDPRVSILVSVGCQKPVYLAARLGCAETKVTTWDDLAFKLIILGWNVQNDTGYNVFTNDLQHSDQSQSISNTCLVETDDSNVIPNSPDMCDDDIQNDQNDVESDDERVALANLIANLKLDTEFEKYKAFNDRTIDYDKLERKLNETLGQLALKYIEIKEGLKFKAYEISVVKEKQDELIKQSLLTKSHYEGLVKQKTKAVGSGENGRKRRREWLQGLAGKTVECTVF